MSPRRHQQKKQHAHRGPRRERHSRRTATPHPQKTFVGIIDVTRRGTGFLPHASFARDIMIAPFDRGSALDGDEVEVTLLSRTRDERAQGRVVAVRSRARTKFVVRLISEGSSLFGTARGRGPERVLFAPAVEASRAGELALVTITDWGDGTAPPRATITEYLGMEGAHETEMRAATVERGFDSTFPTAVEEEARTIAGRFSRDLNAALEHREDFREVPTCTIDPEHAQDFDDALSLRELPKGMLEVGVHIADVTHYVRPGTALDQHAREKGTSVYLVDRTLPMLPEALSNDVCSLKPDEPRLAFSVIFTLDRHAHVHAHRFARTVIRSERRFTYRIAQDLINAQRANSALGDPWAERLTLLATLAKDLRAAREQDGVLDFDADEIGFALDAEKRPVRVFVKERLETMRLIEEFMLLANRTVAESIRTLSKGRADTTFIYRVHDTPDRERIEELALFVRAIGYDLVHQNGTVHRKELARLLRTVKGTPHEAIVHTTALRSLAKAVYSHKNIGHFSLGFKDYTHFTSPIRRYADIMAHRILASHLADPKTGAAPSPLSREELGAYEAAAVHASEREVLAVEAERDSIKFKQTEYLAQRIGEVFAGTITGVTEHGAFIAEKESRAEGFARVAEMEDDHYDLDDHGYTLVGNRTGRRLGIGDTVAIRLKRVNVPERQIDWEILPVGF